MTNEVINQYLDELGHRLINESAVYIFREDGIIVHVGETKNLNAQMIKLCVMQKIPSI